MRNICLKYRTILMFLALGFLNIPLNGQSANFQPSDFSLSGTAMTAGSNCFQLTESIEWQGGSMWFRNSLDLNKNFEIEMELTFGCNDEGADGIVFILHPWLTTGYRGEGMGFGGLYPSLGLEMDTYENPRRGDPWYDHVALMIHGMTSHWNGITGPIPIMQDKGNVEDCDFHWVKIKWDANEHILQFYFDQSLRIQQEIDLVKDVFEGDSEVYWGFTSATGAKYNRHKICIEKIKYEEPYTLRSLDRRLLLDGEKYILKELDFSSGSYILPEDSKKELDKLIYFIKQHPDQSVILNGYTDSAGNAGKNQQISELRAKAVAEYIISKGIQPYRVYFYGNGEKDPIETNETPEGRKANRRVEVLLRVMKV